MAKTLTPALRTIFADLTQQVETAPPAGSTYTQSRNGILYAHAKFTVGIKRVDKHLGRADDPEISKQVAALRTGMDLAKQRRETVRMLRKAGFAGPDTNQGPILAALAHAGLFSKGAVLISTAAYMLSENLIGQFLPEQHLGTEDVAVATPDLRIAADDPSDNLVAILQRADPSFDGIPELDGRRYRSGYRNSAGYLVELVTPRQTEDDKVPLHLNQLEAGAAPLVFLKWLIMDPVSVVALWDSGIMVQIPHPVRFAVHKLIVAQIRTGTNRLQKRQKDLAQAQAVLLALQVNDPWAISDALDDARSQGPSWAQAIDRSLHELEPWTVERQD
ncbi:GSU2403 family nucleotidyltransferase fold protein [Sphingosinicella sp. BN140058]|uniref:GSU2403 family nucleotidyltransferase fold protein n=1 Tax=Sphingosinicella sp. BN140058 TaxID=1892855 RepID=UPI0010122D21|nr:GSU2403 family nucleotidyltransferase fold protein [Sphingosinicella sp. BN140058]QAY80234.1 hypothetical protein ETR14_26690 [Sphingosinicella sp. BN140058]